MDNYLEILAQKIGEDIRLLRGLMGISGGGGSLAVIDDDALSRNTTWSSVKITEYVAELLDNLADISPETLGAILDIVEALKEDESLLLNFQNRLAELEARPPSLALGETADTAYRGDYGKAAYIHSKSPHAPVDAQKNSDITKEEIEEKLTGVIESHTHDVTGFEPANAALSAHLTRTDNPHEVTLAQLNGEPAFAKHSAFNKSFGDASGTVCEGNDSRLSDARFPLTHSHSADTITETAERKFITDAERTYWNNKSGLELGETLYKAYRGDRGKIAFDHSQLTHAPANAQKNSDITKAEIEAKLTGDIQSHTHSDLGVTPEVAAHLGDKDNPHSVTAFQIGAEPAFVKKSAFNKDFGETKGTVCDGDDPRLSDPRHPLLHKHSADDIIETDDRTFVALSEKMSWWGKSDLVLGNTETTAHRGDHGTSAYEHSLSAHAPVDAQKNSDITKDEIEAKLTGEIESHTHPAVSAEDVGAEPAFSKNTAFNKDFGTTNGTVCSGDDPRLSDARTPTEHLHRAEDVQETSSKMFVSAEDKARWDAGTGSGDGATLGETEFTAYRGDRGKIAYDHSLTGHAPVDAQKNSDITKFEIEAKLTGEIESHTHPVASLDDIELGEDASKIVTPKTLKDFISGLNLSGGYGGDFSFDVNGYFDEKLGYV